MTFAKNMGTVDRALRIAVGLVLLALAFTTLTGALTWLAALVGVVFIATSAISFCPLYPLIGLKTCKDC